MWLKILAKEKNNKDILLNQIKVANETNHILFFANTNMYYVL